MTGSTGSAHHVAEAALLDHLRQTREGLVSKRDELSERDRRRPLTGTGTNLLGLVKHLVDTSRHAGQADIVRELIDGRGGSDQVSFGGEAEWRAYVDRVARAADSFAQ